MRHLLAATGIALLAACAQLPGDGGPGGDMAASATAAGLPAAASGAVTARRISLPMTLPPMKAFAGSAVLRPTRSNARIAGDFLDLAFRLESGRALPVLSRFEGPVSVAVRGRAPAPLLADLDRLLNRLRSEAEIDIRRAEPGRPGAITLEIVPRAQLQALVPQAACFVAPNVSSWREYKRLRGRPETDWTRLGQRRRMAVFLPGDVAPQEMRDCLHEEIAQALGPVNDLYRLSDSVFNDDNFHTVLTGFDMLILRAYYAPELASGMTRDQVAARLPAILARLNPAGGAGAPVAPAPTPLAWKRAIETALGAEGGAVDRARAAQRAVAIARGAGWNDSRLAFSLFALARLNLTRDPARALAAFTEAERLYRSLPGARLQAANMGVQRAAYALSGGRAQEALAIVDRHLQAARNAQNAALLSTFLMIKAEALALRGQTGEAGRVRLDSLGWARYGFGSEAEIRDRLGEIAAIAARAGAGG